jgi:glycosyltransferase involved in cell wall biosynthesis
MRVLLVSQEMPPETGWGGIGTYVATLAPALAAAGAEVRVLSVVAGQAAGDTTVGGYIIHRRPLRRPPGVGRLTGLPQAWHRLSLAAAVAREAARLDFEPDVVEAPEWNAEGLVLTLRRRWPLVVRLHSSAEQLFPYARRRALDARASVALERRSIAGADVLVTTRANLGALDGRLRRLPQTRAVPLPVAPAEGTGTGPVAGGATGSAEPGTGGSAEPPGRQIVFVGRLERVKAPETLVSAARIVLERFPDARIVFLGADTGRAPGSYLSHLRELAARLGVEHALEFAGHRPRAEVIARVRQSAVAAFPSRTESFGYGAAEAASLNVPVVASRIPAFVDLFGDAARLVAVDDVEAWGAALVALLEDPDKAQRLAHGGKQRVLAQCAPDRVAAQMLEAYELAQARRPTGATRNARR